MPRPEPRDEVWVSPHLAACPIWNELAPYKDTVSILEQNPDGEMRAAAFLALRRLRAEKGVLTAVDLQAGFQFKGERIPFSNTQRGIWKPGRMQHLLSIKTVYPKPGSRVWYSDQYKAREEVYRTEEYVAYAF